MDRIRIRGPNDQADLVLDYPAIAIGFYETGGYDVMIESYFKATASNMNYVVDVG